MELIIGRDGATAKLKVVNGTQVNLYGEAASVPVDVSRQHCQLTAIDDNTRQGRAGSKPLQCALAGDT